jgi:hypothetical protein
LNWNWDPHHWKKSTKVLLGAATIWPIVYMGLFFLTIFSLIFLIGFAENSSDNNSEDIDLIQLEKKYLYIWRDAPAGTMASTNNVGDKSSL